MSRRVVGNGCRDVAARSTSRNMMCREAPPSHQSNDEERQECRDRGGRGRHCDRAEAVVRAMSHPTVARGCWREPAAARLHDGFDLVG
jgi:hypothetical protein